MKRARLLPDNIDNIKEPLFLFFLFLASALFRLPTLFNDYYDADELAAIVQTKEYLAGYIPGVDFTESKLPLYHAIFKFSYYLNAAYGWVIVHAITILFVFLTAAAVYYTGKLLRDRRTGITASLLYAVLISSFNRHFMATNGEIIYNLPIAAGFLFFLIFIKYRPLKLRIISAVIVALSAFAAMKVKVHGSILLIFILFFIFFYLPYYKRILRRMVLPYVGLAAAALALTAFDFYVTKKFAPGIVKNIGELLFYASSGRSSNPLNLVAIYSYKQLTIGLWHVVLWVPAAIYAAGFIRNGFRRDTVEESAVALFAVVTFLMVFAGGARLYYHYFMTSYPYLCVIAAMALVSSDNSAVRRLRDNFTVAVLIPGLFFLCWNFKDIYIKYFNQDLFYNEPAAAFWFRAVAVSSMDDYLLPNGSYRNTVDYIKKNTSPADTIFVWGDGPHLYYFSDRRIAVTHVWPKGTAIHIEDLYKSGKPESVFGAVAEQTGFVRTMEKKKPVLFIDTSPKGLFRSVTRLGNFARFPYEVPPVMRNYLDSHYALETVVDDFKIYRRVK